jgi:hypothetical protein
VRTNDFEEGYRLSTRLIGLASAIGRVSAMQAVMNGQANASNVRVDINDWLYGRFLNTQPAPTPAPTGPARYWGAR